jgi:peptidoglycan/xylan/chitin deacetylase (PgdA/CDA1 family)
LRGDEKPPDKTVVITFDDGFRNNYTQAFPILKMYGFTATVFLTIDHINGVCTWDKHESIPEIPLLSWDEIREMSTYGIDFGSHGCTHRYMTRLSREEMEMELQESKSTIEVKLGKPADFFCHPYGDTNRQTQQLVEDCGYVGAFGGADFSLANSKDNLYDLGRLGTAHFTSIWDFRAGLLGTYGWYLRVKEVTHR